MKKSFLFFALFASIAPMYAMQQRGLPAVQIMRLRAQFDQSLNQQNWAQAQQVIQLMRNGGEIANANEWERILLQAQQVIAQMQAQQAQANAAQAAQAAKKARAERENERQLRQRVEKARAAGQDVTQELLDEIEARNQQIAKLEQQLKKIQDAHNQLAQLNEKLLAERLALLKRLEECQKRMAEAQARLEAVQKQLEEQRRLAAEGLAKARQGYEKQIAELQQQLQAARKARDEAIGKGDAAGKVINERVAQLERQLQAAQRANDAVILDMRNTAARLAQCEERARLAQARSRELEIALAKSQAAVEQSQKILEQERAGFQKQIKAAQNANGALLDDLRNTAGRMAQGQQEVRKIAYTLPDGDPTREALLRLVGRR